MIKLSSRWTQADLHSPNVTGTLGHRCYIADRWSQRGEDIWRIIMLWVAANLIKTPEGLALLRLIWKEKTASRGKEEETYSRLMERERKKGIREEIPGWLFRKICPLDEKAFVRTREWRANMIGFGWKTWGSTLPEDEGKRMGYGERKNDERKGRVWTSGCLCGRGLVA